MSAVTRDSRDSMFIGPGLLNRERLYRAGRCPVIYSIHAEGDGFHGFY